MKFRFLFVILLIVFLGTFSYADSNKLVEKSSESVIMIETDKGLGSGFFVNQDGYILTNFHVVKDASEIKFKIENKEFKAIVKAKDENLDVALLKTDEIKNIPALILADSDKISDTEDVYAIGSPSGLEKTTTKGIISNKARKLDENSDLTYIQIDAVINPGSSGGPLLNDKGEVIGINTAIDRETGNYGFALPINKAKSVLESDNISYIKTVKEAINTTQPEGTDTVSPEGEAAPQPSVPGNIVQNKWILVGSIVVILLIIAAIVFFILKNKKKIVKGANAPKPVDTYDDINIALGGNASAPQSAPKDNYDDIDIELH